MEALGFQRFNKLKYIPFKVLVSDANLHPYTEGKGANAGQVDSAVDRDATRLRSQLEPISTPQLRARLARAFGVETDPESVGREGVMVRRCKLDPNLKASTFKF